MADRIIKPDSGDDLILQNDDASAKIEVKEDGTNEVTGSVTFPHHQLYQAANSIRNQSNKIIIAAGTSGLSITDDNNDYTEVSIDSDGVMTKPRQPAFLQRGDDGAAPTLTSGSYLVINSDYLAEVFDQGGDVASGVFTAPITGRYYFSANVYHYDTTSGDAIYFRLATSNKYYYSWGLVRSGSVVGMASINMLTDMDASDTAQIEIQNATSARGEISVSSNWLTFSGALIC